tara:strand:+ start:282 stop:467 length:186 start_codon:yes stop_codon:yes gene_type:complete
MSQVNQTEPNKEEVLEVLDEWYMWGKTFASLIGESVAFIEVMNKTSDILYRKKYIHLPKVE